MYQLWGCTVEYGCRLMYSSFSLRDLFERWFRKRSSFFILKYLHFVTLETCHVRQTSFATAYFPSLTAVSGDDLYWGTEASAEEREGAPNIA